MLDEAGRPSDCISVLHAVRTPLRVPAPRAGVHTKRLHIRSPAVCVAQPHGALPARTLRSCRLQRILRSISPYSKISEANWQAYAGKWLAKQYELQPEDSVLHGIERGAEAVAYAAMTAQQRCGSATAPRCIKASEPSELSVNEVLRSSAQSRARPRAAGAASCACSASCAVTARTAAPSSTSPSCRSRSSARRSPRAAPPSPPMTSSSPCGPPALCDNNGTGNRPCSSSEGALVVQGRHTLSLACRAACLGRRAHARRVQEDFCKAPWGVDGGGCSYWLHDLGKGRGLRLCREEPAAPPAAAAVEPAGAGKRARMAPDAQAGAWATIACGIDEIEQVPITPFPIALSCPNTSFIGARTQLRVLAAAPCGCSLLDTPREHARRAGSVDATRKCAARARRWASSCARAAGATTWCWARRSRTSSWRTTASAPRSARRQRRRRRRACRRSSSSKRPGARASCASARRRAPATAASGTAGGLGAGCGR